MIDFENKAFLKLRPVKDDDYAKVINPMLISGEHIVQSFKSVRDGVVFTNKRIFAINVQGVTGKKKDFTILPYKKIQVFSVETSGLLDIDCELNLWFSSLGMIRFEFLSNTEVPEICRTISECLL